jgi:diguanylate cyclase (GGDEF)-like protein/hemerythrin-like metal-binding protein
MLLQRLLPQSLKSRVTLLTIFIVVSGFLALSAYVKGLLRDELILYTGAQQRSALKLLGGEVTQHLQNRIETLSVLASDLAPVPLQDTAALNDVLRTRYFLDPQFNAGVSIWNAQGVLLASNGSFVDRSVVVQDLSRFLQTGQPGIGRMSLLGEPRTAAFAMYVPIRNASGAVVGAVAGSIRMDKPNFLTTLASHRYGKTGNFFLIEASQRLIFATSDASRRMETLPSRGVSPWIDRFVDGFEGTARAVNPHGVEVLVSIEQIPLAHWYASVTLAPGEVFELLDTVKPRSQFAAAALLAVLLMLIWLMVRWQLSPMTTAVSMLEGFLRKNQPPQPLPVVRQDEVGQLVGGFNQLLDSLVQQKKVVQDSEDFKQAVLNSVTSAIAVLDHGGTILSINDAWAQFSHEFMSPPGASGIALGANFLAAWEGLPADARHSNALSAEEGIRAVLEGQLPRFHLEYCVAASAPQHWRSMSVTPFKGAVLQGAVVAIEDISERVEMQRQVRELASYDPLTKLPNRRLALERLTQQLARARRAQSRLALLFIDLDRFKPINDELGHDVGDWLLQAVAQRIQACLRESDTAARMGGDEFVVLLPDLQTIEAATAVGEKIRNELERDFVTPRGLVLQISSSIGVAICPDHGDSEETLLRLGDEAMYKAKRAGRNAVQVWAPSAPAGDEAAAHPEPQIHVHLRWKPAFACGHALIDQEHEALFSLANTLLDAAALRESSPAEFDAAFDALLNHAAEHFAHEETILQAHGYADLAEHAQLHRVLLDHARAVHAAAHASDVTTVDGLIHFLVSELVAGHMLGADRAFESLFSSRTQWTNSSSDFRRTEIGLQHSGH